MTVRVFTNGKENIYLDERLIKNFDLKNQRLRVKVLKVLFTYMKMML